MPADCGKSIRTAGNLTRSYEDGAPVVVGINQVVDPGRDHLVAEGESVAAAQWGMTQTPPHVALR
jgi:hypothetical protein